MPVHGLDHVNILATDLAASRAFYAEVLGLVPADAPGQRLPATWLCDTTGRAIIHLGAAGDAYAGDRRVGEPTAAVHHVALACSDYDAMLARVDALGLGYRASGPRGTGFRQIFLTDPSNVALELNFPD